MINKKFGILRFIFLIFFISLCSTSSTGLLMDLETTPKCMLTLWCTNELWTAFCFFFLSPLLRASLFKAFSFEKSVCVWVEWNRWWRCICVKHDELSAWRDRQQRMLWNGERTRIDLIRWGTEVFFSDFLCNFFAGWIFWYQVHARGFNWRNYRT